jgi:hypothetical protein
MRTNLPELELPAQPSHPQAARNCCPSPALASLLALALAALAGCTLAAQTPPAPTAPADKPAARTIHPHKRHSAATAEPAPTPVTPAPVTPPPAPEVPKWPVNEKAEDATVTWDSRGLSVSASNSSLQQILNEIATETGAKVEGIEKDERIFGAYGPGQPRDVLSQLLEGSGYNVLMIGDQGQGAPRQIVLTARHSGEAPGAKPAATPTADEDVEVEDPNPQQQQQQPVNPPFRPAFNPGNQPRPNQPLPGQPQPGTPPNQ